MTSGQHHVDESPESLSYLRFEAVRVQSSLSVSDLWVRYLSAGGHCDILDIDAHLNGVLALDRRERDTLAYALNERIDELARAARIPYLNPIGDTSASLQDVIAELLADG